MILDIYKLVIKNFNDINYEDLNCYNKKFIATELIESFKKELTFEQLQTFENLLNVIKEFYYERDIDLCNYIFEFIKTIKTKL